MKNKHYIESRKINPRVLLQTQARDVR